MKNRIFRRRWCVVYHRYRNVQAGRCRRWAPGCLGYGYPCFRAKLNAFDLNRKFQIWCRRSVYDITDFIIFHQNGLKVAPLIIAVISRHMALAALRHTHYIRDLSGFQDPRVEPKSIDARMVVALITLSSPSRPKNSRPRKAAGAHFNRFVTLRAEIRTPHNR